MEFINCKQSVIERLDAKFLKGKSKRRVGTNQQAILRSQESSKRIDLSPSVPGALQRFHCGATVQSEKNPSLASRVLPKLARSTFGNDNDRLLQVLAVKFVESYEH